VTAQLHQVLAEPELAVSHRRHDRLVDGPFLASHDEVADLLVETLREEQDALEQLTGASERFDEQQIAGD